MIVSNQRRAYGLTFRTVRFWLWVKSGLLLTAALGFLGVALYTNHYWVSVISLLSVSIIFFLYWDYLNRSITIRDNNLVYRRGVLSLKSEVIPILTINVRTRQSLLGQVMDYGTVWICAGDNTMYVSQVASLNRFCQALVQEQNALLESPHGLLLAAGSHNRYHHQP